MAATRRRPRNSLSLRQIVTAALAVVDRDGLDGLKIRTVAEELGVPQMSLYTYVRGKDELIEAMITAVSDSSYDCDLSQPPIERLFRAWHGEREAQLAHPNLIPLIVTRDSNLHRGELALAQVTIQALLELGATHGEAAIMMGVISRLSIGSLLSRHTVGERSPDDIYWRRLTSAWSALPDSHPVLAELARAGIPRMSQEEMFVAGVEALIRGFLGPRRAAR